MTQSDIINNNFSKTFECIKCSNAYDTGEVLSEEKLFKQISERKHSTFDKSKFTVVGSPTITDDGVASRFSGGNYLDILNIDVTNKEFEIDLGKQLTPPSFITSSYMISGQNNRQNLFSIGIRNGKIFAGCNSIYFNGILPNYPLQTNTYYWIKGGVKNNLAYLMISTDGINYATYTDTLTNTYTSCPLLLFKVSLFEITKLNLISVSSL